MVFLNLGICVIMCLAVRGEYYNKGGDLSLSEFLYEPVPDFS